MINNMYQVLVKCFSILFGINLVYMLVLSFKFRSQLFQSSQTNSNSQESTPTTNNSYNYLMIIIGGATFFVVSLLAIFVWKQHWIQLLFSVLWGLRLGYYAISSATTVSSIIKDTRNKTLTIIEKSAIMILACVFFTFHPANWLETIVSWLSIHFDSYLLDLCLCLVYSAVIFIILFVSVSFLQTPLSLLAKGYIHIITHISTDFKQKYLLSIQDTDAHPIRKNFWCVPFISFARRCRKFWKPLMCLCVPLVVIADYLMTLLAFFWGLIRDILVYILRILHQLAKILQRLSEKITKWSDRQVVSLSFRFATLASIASIVIINRIDSFFVHTEQSTAILEFIASAVVIPVIYSWINAWIAKKKASKNTDK